MLPSYDMFALCHLLALDKIHFVHDFYLFHRDVPHQFASLAFLHAIVP